MIPFATIVLVVAEWRRLLRSLIIPLPFGAGFSLALLGSLYLAEIAIVYSIAGRSPHPIPVVPWSPDRTIAIAALLAIGAMQALLLAQVYRSGTSRLSKSAIALTAGTMLLASLATPVLVNPDLYAYVGNSLLGYGAYNPPALAFPPQYEGVNAAWGIPMPPTTYGPLWIALVTVVTSAAPSLVLKMLALRVMNAICFGMLLVALRACGTSSRLLAVIVVNPGVYFQYILNAHNDIVPAAITVVAAVLLPVLPMLGVLVLATAALVKITFALLGLPILYRLRTFSARTAAAILVFAMAAASLIVTGPQYFTALVRHVSSLRLEIIAHLIAGFAAVVCIAAAVLGFKRLRTAVWLIPMIGAYTPASYAIWSLPYALSARRILLYWSIWLPLVAILLEQSLARAWTLWIVLPLLLAASFRLPSKSALNAA